MELWHLEKDYLLLDARLRLIRKNTDPALASGKCRILEFTPLFLPLKKYHFLTMETVSRFIRDFLTMWSLPWKLSAGVSMTSLLCGPYHGNCQQVYP